MGVTYQLLIFPFSASEGGEKEKNFFLPSFKRMVGKKPWKKGKGGELHAFLFFQTQV